MSTLIGAGVFALSDYVKQYSREDRDDRDRAREYVKKDTAEDLKSRALWGGLFGAAGGCLYVLRCLIKGDEP